MGRVKERGLDGGLGYIWALLPSNPIFRNFFALCRQLLGGDILQRKEVTKKTKKKEKEK